MTDEAVAQLQQIARQAARVATDPCSGAQWNDLGAHLGRARRAGRGAEALALARSKLPGIFQHTDSLRVEVFALGRAVALTHEDPVSWLNLIMALADAHSVGELDEALAVARGEVPALPEDPLQAEVFVLARAAALHPSNSTAWRNLGITLTKARRANRGEEAVGVARGELPDHIQETDPLLTDAFVKARAVALAPTEGVAWNDLGVALRDARHDGRGAEALAMAQRELPALLQEADPLRAEVFMWARAVALAPADARTWLSLGETLVAGARRGRGTEVRAMLAAGTFDLLPREPPLAAAACFVRATRLGSPNPSALRFTVRTIRAADAPTPDVAAVLAETGQPGPPPSSRFEWVGLVAWTANLGVADPTLLGEVDAALGAGGFGLSRCPIELASAVGWGLGLGPLQDHRVARAALALWLPLRTGAPAWDVFAAESPDGRSGAEPPPGGSAGLTELGPWLIAHPEAVRSAVALIRATATAEGAPFSPPLAPIIEAGGHLATAPLDDPRVDAVGLACWVYGTALALGDVAAYDSLLACLEAARAEVMPTRGDDLRACAKARAALHARVGPQALDRALQVLEGRLVARAARLGDLPEVAALAVPGTPLADLGLLGRAGGQGMALVSFLLEARRATPQTRALALAALERAVALPTLVPKRRLLGALPPDPALVRVADRAATVLLAGLEDAAGWPPDDKERAGELARTFARPFGEALPGVDVEEVGKALAAEARAARLARKDEVISSQAALLAATARHLGAINDVLADLHTPGVDVTTLLAARRRTILDADALVARAGAAESPEADRLARELRRLLDLLRERLLAPRAVSPPPEAWAADLPAALLRELAMAERLRAIAPALDGDHAPAVLYLGRATEAALAPLMRSITPRLSREDAAWLREQRSSGTDLPARAIEALRRMESQGGPTLGAAGTLADTLATAPLDVLASTPPPGTHPLAHHLALSIAALPPRPRRALTDTDPTERVSHLANHLAPLRNRAAHAKRRPAPLGPDAYATTRDLLLAGDRPWLQRLLS